MYSKKREVVLLRTHDLFLHSEDEGRDFQSVLQEIQAYLSKEYSNLVTGDGNEEIKAQIRRFGREVYSG